MNCLKVWELEPGAGATAFWWLETEGYVDERRRREKPIKCFVDQLGVCENLVLAVAVSNGARRFV